MPRVFKNSVLIEPFRLDFKGFTLLLDDLAGSRIETIHVVRRPGYTLVNIRGESIQVAVAPFTIIIPPEHGETGIFIAEKHVLQYYVNQKDSWLDYSAVDPAYLSSLLKQFESTGEFRVSDWIVKTSEASIECERVVAADYVYTSLAGFTGHYDFLESRIVEALREKSMRGAQAIILGFKGGEHSPLVEAYFDEKKLLVSKPSMDACPDFWRIIHWLITDLATSNPE